MARYCALSPACTAPLIWAELSAVVQGEYVLVPSIDSDVPVLIPAFELQD